LVNQSIRHHAGLLEDIPIQAGKFVIPCNLIATDMDESSLVWIALGRPFLATAREIIGTMSF